ncbi:hypothetical protein PQC07_gp254 [Aeromonas phage D3]|uniref:Uncharacterized protein n=2 Tax=Ludhianavirus TaxID=3044751 RepID=A0A514TVM5_9CAUD|nr:hypothetical protein PQC07_gp254 [Aeromonas phage D3]YP_010668770.1 hypothetical protein PQC08_gp253 [Aeromonas phage D6]QDJ97020.1 hypothetical protein D3_0021 [Aeromonas phage D3]QDJ97182.1 hypothetical protein D6_0022 [Aeromonas phage D6]
MYHITRIDVCDLTYKLIKHLTSDTYIMGDGLVIGELTGVILNPGADLGFYPPQGTKMELKLTVKDDNQDPEIRGWSGWFAFQRQDAPDPTALVVIAGVIDKQDNELIRTVQQRDDHNQFFFAKKKNFH